MICDFITRPDVWDNQEWLARNEISPPGSLRYRVDGYKLYVLGYPRKVEGRETLRDGNGTWLAHTGWYVPCAIYKGGGWGNPYWQPRWVFSTNIYTGRAYFGMLVDKANKKAERAMVTLTAEVKAAEKWFTEHYEEWDD